MLSQCVLKILGKDLPGLKRQVVGRLEGLNARPALDARALSDSLGSFLVINLCAAACRFGAQKTIFARGLSLILTRSSLN